MRLFAFAILAVAAVSGNQLKKICEPGTMTKVECNDCRCSADGTFQMCTLKLCYPDERQRREVPKEDVQIDEINHHDSAVFLNGPVLDRHRRQVSHNRPCVPGSQFKIYCNTCGCGADGFSVFCTRMECDKRIYNEDGSLKVIAEVPSNEMVRQKRQVSHNRPCVPGSQFKIYCNTCGCGADGFSVFCTRMECDKRIYNEDGSLKVIAEVPSNEMARQKRQVSHNRPCVPGSQFKIYCNTCGCGADGFSVSCTRMECDKRIYNEDGSLKVIAEVPSNEMIRQKRQVSHNRPCVPKSQFKIYCNKCSCGDDGFSVACTRKACPEGMYNEDGSLKGVAEVPSNEMIREERQVRNKRSCEPGTSFKMYCNTCWCGDDGEPSHCTRKGCRPGMYNSDGSLRVVGETSNNNLLRQKRHVSHDKPFAAGSRYAICNACFNGDYEYEVACLKVICPLFAATSEEVENNKTNRQKRQLSQGETCEPGKEFKDYCNTCKCGLDGVSKMCTMMACDESVYNKDGSLKNPLLRQKRQLSQGETCEPGKEFKDYCNTCKCGLDGVSKACTMMACDESVFNKDGSLKNPLLRQKRQLSQGETCEPGKEFKDYCNTCKCGLDGVSKACTMMACDESVFNKDGSLKNPLLRQKRQLSQGETCEPGKEFKDYCNTCKCGLDGVSKMCTMMACDESVFNKDGSLKNPLLRQKRQLSQGETCEPGKEFKDYCNTCKCGLDGVSKMCTMMACDESVFNKDGSLKNPLLRQKRQLSQGETCEPGKEFKDYCNTCKCGLDGVSKACTMMACDESVFNKDGSLKNPLLRQKRQLSQGETCEPGKEFKDYCNTCKCGLDGVSKMCTMMACDESVYNKDGSLKNPLLRQKRQLSQGETCEPGKEFKDYCNTCKCGLDGISKMCTMMACDESVYNKDGSLKNPLLRQKRQVSHNRPCTPKSQFKIYCNTCSCGDDGFSVACTRMMCPEGVYNEDGSLKNVEEVPKNPLLRTTGSVSHNRPCTPKSQFKIYCNTCSCGDDGFSVACTRMMCPEGVYNEDGSLKNIGGVPENALVRQNRQVSHNRPCTPRSQFKIYCNTCSCGDDGFSVACTRMMCPEGVYNEDGSLKNVEAATTKPLLRTTGAVSHNRPCTPKSQFKIYCNTCSCGDDGFSVACTRMMCPEGVYNEDGSLKNIGGVPDNALVRQKRQVSHNRPCTPRSQFKIYCNTCSCGDDGFSVACTRMMCPEGVYNEDGSLKNVEAATTKPLLRTTGAVSHNRPCTPKSQFKIYCNTCSCGDDGFSVACTRMMCPEGVYNEDGSLKNIGGVPENALVRQKRQLSQGETCEPGKSFKDYCNTCKCGLDGVSKICTMMACDERVYNKDGSLKNPLLRQKRQVSHNRPCTPRSQFKIYCNTCSCGDDGFSVACTRMMCPEGVYNEDGSLKNIGGVPDNALVRQKRQLSQGETCEPGKSFKDYCNTCKCGLDGVSKICTMMACDERVYNKDGSLKNPLLRQKRQLSQGETCEPGKSFKDYCNTCKCGLDGVSKTCTMMACDPKVWNKDGTLKNLAAVPTNPLLRQKRQLSPGTTCEPGKTFYDYCNTCSCQPDGVTMWCTLMACDERVWNKDGTKKNLGGVQNNA